MESFYELNAVSQSLVKGIKSKRNQMKPRVSPNQDLIQTNRAKKESENLNQNQIKTEEVKKTTQVKLDALNISLKEVKLFIERQI